MKTSKKKEIKSIIGYGALHAKMLVVTNLAWSRIIKK